MNLITLFVFLHRYFPSVILSQSIKVRHCCNIASQPIRFHQGLVTIELNSTNKKTINYRMKPFWGEITDDPVERKKTKKRK